VKKAKHPAGTGFVTLASGLLKKKNAVRQAEKKRSREAYRRHNKGGGGTDVSELGLNEEDL